MRPALFRLVAAILLCVLALPFSAAEAGGPRFALVIGNGNYAELGKLKNPANDAADMAAALKELGFKVRLLVDADLPAMEDAVVRLGNDLSQSADSIGFFFYAGHGVQSGGTNYLIPSDTRIASEAFLKSKALPAQSVLDTLQGARNSLNIVVLDACRDNPFSWGRSASRGLNVVGSQPPGSIVAYATSAGSIAQDGTGRNGVFTLELLKQIKTPGLEIAEVFKRTGAAVQSSTAGKQVPAVYNQFFGNAYLAGAKGRAAAAVAASGAPEAASPPAAPATPTITITRSYGSLVVSAATAGALYLDGVKVADLPAGAEARLDNVEAGERLVELRYASGDKEAKSVGVEKGQSASVAFAWKKGAGAAPKPAPAGKAAAASGGFIRVPAGSFLMGSPSAEVDRQGTEGPQHEVAISSFEIGRYEVTQDEWAEIMGTNPASFKGNGLLPVEKVSWFDVLAYCNKRSIKEKLTPCYSISGSTDPSRWTLAAASAVMSPAAVSCDFQANGYRLPTEAEWEYACRAGTQTATAFGDTMTSSQANFDGATQYNVAASGSKIGKTSAVGSYAPNAWGIYDMHGNVWEWCWDRYEKDYYAKSPSKDPQGPAAGTNRVLRGGSWINYGRFMRSACRSSASPTSRDALFGFRLVRRP